MGQTRTGHAICTCMLQANERSFVALILLFVHLVVLVILKLQEDPPYGSFTPQPTVLTLGSIPAWTIQAPYLPQPRFFNRCPPMAPIQLRFYPLASLGQDQAAVVGPHGFVPISSDRLDCLSPPRLARPTSAPTPSVETLNQLIDTTRRTYLSLVKHWRPEPWVCVIGVATTLLVIVTAVLSIKLMKLSTQHAETLDTEKDLLAAIGELHVLTEKTLKTAQGLIESGRRTTVSRDEVWRLADNFEDVATELVEVLAAVTPQNLAWAGIRRNGFLVPQHVLHNPAPVAVVPTAVEDLVDPPLVP